MSENSEIVTENMSENSTVNSIEQNNLDKIIEIKLDNCNLNSNEFTNDLSSNNSSQNDLSNSNTNLKSGCEGIEINDVESKYLEEQANMKILLEESESRCRHLSSILTQKDEVIGRIEKEKMLLEKEKMIVS